MLLAVAAAVALLLVVVADVVATEVAESRLSATVSRSLGLDATVEVGPWPATPRLLAGRLTVDVQASPAPAGAAANSGSPPALRAVEGQLTGVELDSGWQALTAEEVRAELTFDPGQVPFGTTTATLDGTDVRATFGRRGSVVTATRTDVLGRGASASATDLRLVMEETPTGSRSTSLTAASASLEATRDIGTGNLPLDVDRFAVDVVDLTLDGADGQATRVRASRAAVEAGGVPLEGTDARLQDLTASIPQLAVDHLPGARELVIAGSGATFSVELDEQELEALWEGPGRVELLDGVVRLAVGPLAIDVDVHADGRQLVLTPRLPPAIALVVGQVPPVPVTPRLPEGVTLWQATVTSEILRIAGGGDRIVLPLR